MFVDGGPRRTPSKPVFVQPLQNKDVQEGSRAHLRCVVQGFPQPEVSGLACMHDLLYSVLSTE